MLKNGLFVILCLGLFLVGCQPAKPKARRKSNGVEQTSQKPTQKDFMGLEVQTAEGEKLRPVHFMDGNLAILIPDAFEKMSENQLVKKFPKAGGPRAGYCNRSDTVSLAVNYTKTKMPASKMDALHRSLDQGVRKAKPTAKWMYSGVQIYDGRKWVQLEFNDDSSGVVSHNVMMASSFQGRLVVINFNSTDENSEKWLKVGRKIYPSVRLAK